MKKSLLPYILVAAIGVTAGVGITAVLEDVAGMPYEKVDFNLFDPENVNIDALIDMIADHPEWSDPDKAIEIPSVAATAFATHFFIPNLCIYNTLTKT